MVEEIRAWLSIQFISIGISICPYEEMRYLLRKTISENIDEYLDESK